MNRNIYILVLLAMSSLLILQHLYLGTFNWKGGSGGGYAEFRLNEPVHLSTDDFGCYLERCPFPAVVNFTASWSENAAAMDERFKALQKQYRGRVCFCIVDIDENSELTSIFNIHSIPQILYFCDGEQIKLETDGDSDAESEPQVELFLDHCCCS